jgi:hypothetical protein
MLYIECVMCKNYHGISNLLYLTHHWFLAKTDGRV